MTYSLLETERLLELGEAAEGKKAMETQMLLNHKDAIELVVEQTDKVGCNRYTILNLHALLSNTLHADPQACNRLRAVPVMIGGSVYHPLEIPQLIEECLKQVLSVASKIKAPFEQSFFAMVHLPYVQPFLEVNKRISLELPGNGIIPGFTLPNRIEHRSVMEYHILKLIPVRSDSDFSR